MELEASSGATTDGKAWQKGGWSDLSLPDRPYLQEGDLVLDEGVHGQVGLDLLCQRRPVLAHKATPVQGAPIQETWKNKRWAWEPPTWATVRERGCLRNPRNKPRILRIYLERWMGSWRMKSRYLLTPEDSSLMVSRSSSTSVARAQPDLDTLVFSENSLFISEIHWSELFHCTSRGKPGKGAQLRHLWDESKPTHGQVLSPSTFGLPWWLSQ